MSACTFTNFVRIEVLILKFDFTVTVGGTNRNCNKVGRTARAKGWTGRTIERCEGNEDQTIKQRWDE